MKTRVHPVVLVVAVVAAVVVAATPTQIHLALSNKPSEMVVSWASKDDTPSTVAYGTSPSALSHTANGTSDEYSLLDIYHSPHLHTVTLTGLAPATTYFYQANGGPVLNFTMPLPAGTFPQKFGLLADHGHTNNSIATTDRLLASHHASPFSALLLAGDISYADGWQPTWDLYMRQVQPLASTVPLMVTVGNHEFVEVLGHVLPNLKAYTYRFTMPAPASRANKTLFYSVDIGAMHCIALNSENTTDFGPGTPMHDWLADDLARADANRATVPWITVFWHRPWWSSNHVHGNDTTMRDALEPLLLQHRVNLVHNGHVHAYERTRPIANGTVVGPDDHGIVYLTNGMAGNGEGLYSHWETPTPPFSAFRLAEFGHTEALVVNATHLRLRMVLNANGTVADESWVVQ